MKTNLKFSFIVCCLIPLTNITFGETPPDAASPPASQPAVVRVDEDNSWATLGRLYVILATTDSDEACGKVAENNGNMISRLFQKHVADKAVTVLKIPPQNLSRQTTLSLIANLPIRETDAVVFYYSGKGNFDRKYGQLFELPASKEELYRSEIRSALLARKPRLCVLVSDCCDPTVAMPAPVEEKPVEDQPNEDKPEENDSNEQNGIAQKGIVLENATETIPLFFSLFFTSRGVIDLNSTTYGQASCANENGAGCFTEMFTGLLDVNRNKILSWQRMFPYIREGTLLAFTRSYPNGVNIGEGRQQKEQVPVLLQLRNTVIDSQTQLNIYPPNANANTDAAANTDEQRREEDRKIVLQLVQQAVGELRPFDAGDKGTHENHKALDADNTVLGQNGEPFSKKLEPVAVSSATSTTEGTGQSADTPPQRPVLLGIQASNNNNDGVVITRVVPGFPGQRAGLSVGDVILEIDGKKITSEKEYSDAVDAIASDRVVITTRDKAGRTGPVTIGNLRPSPLNESGDAKRTQGGR